MESFISRFSRKFGEGSLEVIIARLSYHDFVKIIMFMCAAYLVKVYWIKIKHMKSVKRNPTRFDIVESFYSLAVGSFYGRYPITTGTDHPPKENKDIAARSYIRVSREDEPKLNYITLLGFGVKSAMPTVFNSNQSTEKRALINRFLFEQHVKPEVYQRIKFDKELIDRIRDNLQGMSATEWALAQKKKGVRDAQLNAINVGDLKMVRKNFERAGFVKLEKAIGIISGIIQPADPRIVMAGTRELNRYLGVFIKPVQEMCFDMMASGGRDIPTCGMSRLSIGECMRSNYLNGYVYGTWFDRHRFDGSTSPAAIRMLVKWYKLCHIIPESDEIVLRSKLKTDGCTSHGLVYHDENGRVRSGDQDTTFGNTIIAIHVLRYALDKVKIDAVQFAAGDDVLILTKIPLDDQTFDRIREINEEFGYKLKGERCESPAQWKFLSSSPFPTAKGEWVLTPLIGRMFPKLFYYTDAALTPETKFDAKAWLRGVRFSLLYLANNHPFFHSVVNILDGLGAGPVTPVCLCYEFDGLQKNTEIQDPCDFCTACEWFDARYNAHEPQHPGLASLLEWLDSVPPPNEWPYLGDGACFVRCIAVDN